ncbi:hypothetical protein K7432_015307, partial [Basidiobolus ranarum]
MQDLKKKYGAVNFVGVDFPNNIPNTAEIRKSKLEILLGFFEQNPTELFFADKHDFDFYKIFKVIKAILIPLGVAAISLVLIEELTPILIAGGIL